MLKPEQLLDKINESWSLANQISSRLITLLKLSDLSWKFQRTGVKEILNSPELFSKVKQIVYPHLSWEDKKYMDITSKIMFGTIDLSENHIRDLALMKIMKSLDKFVRQMTEGCYKYNPNQWEYQWPWTILLNKANDYFRWMKMQLSKVGVHFLPENIDNQHSRLDENMNNVSVITGTPISHPSYQGNMNDDIWYLLMRCYSPHVKLLLFHFNINTFTKLNKLAKSLASFLEKNQKLQNTYKRIYSSSYPSNILVEFLVDSFGTAETMSLVFERLGIDSLEKLERLFPYGGLTSNLYELLRFRTQKWVVNILDMFGIQTLDGLINFFHNPKYEYLINNFKKLSQFVNKVNVSNVNLLKQFIQKIFSDPYYLNQNLLALVELAEDKNEFTDTDLAIGLELIDTLGWFFVYSLYKKWIEAKDQNERKKIFEEYKIIMNKVLSSDSLDGYDNDLLAEAIYMAYRPTGNDIQTVKNKIQYKIQDLTPQLDDVVFTKEWYNLRFQTTHMSNIEVFDNQKLRQTDKYIFQLPEKNDYVNIIENSLSEKQHNISNLEKLLALVLYNTNDNRVSDYISMYHLLNEYTYDRLTALQEIYKILPSEDIFGKSLEWFLADYPNEFESALHLHLWNKHKANIPETEKKQKNIIDQIIKITKIKENANIDLLRWDLMQIEESPGKHTNNAEKISYCKERKAKILGYDIKTGETLIKNTFLSLLKKQSQKLHNIVFQESKKVEISDSGAYHVVKAIISKNKWSFFAKAGAGLCTSDNVKMRNEKRHIHLNLIFNSQIIGNVMLYFENERDYLVARGFNLRVDMISQYNLEGVVHELIQVIKIIAKENWYDKVYVPVQDSWHALSNRHQIWELITTESNKLLKKWKTAIHNANFYVTELGGTKVDTLLPLI